MILERDIIIHCFDPKLAAILIILCTFELPSISIPSLHFAPPSVTSTAIKEHPHFEAFLTLLIFLAFDKDKFYQSGIIQNCDLIIKSD